MRWKYQAAATLAALGVMSGAAIASPSPDGRQGARLAAATVTRPVSVEPDEAADTAAPEGPEVEPRPPGPTPSVSVGRANRGRLVDGVLLEESELIRFKHGSPEPTRYGTEEMVRMLERAARHVGRELPGSRLTVGDLSRRRGGWLRPHRSHRSGRDVDISFYTVDTEGQPLDLPTFVRFGGNGEGRGYLSDGARFDDARNWVLVEAMLTDPQASVQYVFVSRPLRRRLLAAGEARGASPALLEKAALALEQPRQGGRHDDHFHVRIYCSADDLPRCRDMPPWRPWYTGER